MKAEPARCEALVYRRDTYRRTGRGPSGFEMHYRAGRCLRRAVENGLCRQHLGYGSVTRVDWP